jgi:protein-S-isoprenylcysteine O-methyltransferase Ste14
MPSRPAARASTRYLVRCHAPWMRLLHAIAGFFLFFELPIPIYWLMIHPFNLFWRRRVKAAFLIAAPIAWISGGVLLWAFRTWLLSPTPPSILATVAGFALIGIEIYLFARSERELGGRRLVGQAELTGTGELCISGMYAYARHPRYTGMFSAALGAGLLAGSAHLWGILAVWWAFTLFVILGLEERELASRFGQPYAEYQKRVPAFLPFRLFGR